MSSWTLPTRIGPLPAPNHNDLITQLHNDPLETPTMLRGRFGTSCHRQTRVQVESSSSDSDFAPSKPSCRRPPHSRSLSNPFPSFLGGRKKRATSKPVLDVDGSDDDDTPAKTGGKAHRKEGPSASGSKDFTLGNCMTCASLVRWPKGLSVFKCTICSTVNDLVPLDSNVRGSDRQRPVTSHEPSRSRKPSSGRAQPISLPHTKHLVRQCLRTHISKRLRGARPGSAHEAARNEVPFTMHRGQEGRGHNEPTIDLGQYKDLRQAFCTGRDADQIAPKINSRFGLSSSPHTEPLPLRPTLEVPTMSRQRSPSAGQADDPKRIFKSLEEYVIECFSSFECINSSFPLHQARPATRSAEGDFWRRPDHVRDARDTQSRVHERCAPGEAEKPDSAVIDLDPRLLLLGDVAENGTWWTGGQDKVLPRTTQANADEDFAEPFVPTKTPQVNWIDVKEWYSLINNAAESWFTIYNEVLKDGSCSSLSERALIELEQDILKGQVHCQRVLLKSIELLLKRPGRPLTNPADLRFLLIILDNPQLHTGPENYRGILQPERSDPPRESLPRKETPTSSVVSGQHSGIIKRIIGLLSNSSIDCHNQLISWLARYHATPLVRIKELVSGFLTYRMLRQSEKRQDKHRVDVTAGLIPQIRIGRSGVALHDEIGLVRSPKRSQDGKKFISYSDDWQIKAASRVLSLIFAANNLSASRGGGPGMRDCAPTGAPVLQPSDFYNSMVDYADLVGDFESWESKRSQFSFCQYPFLLSIWAKTYILEYDARRQMQSKARDAFFDSIMTRKAINQYLVLDVRRECLVDDSLQTVSEVIGSGGEDLKKGLRVSFRGEEGIDAGGLRKEWFLLLVREVFNPDHGMFVYDEDSRYCYFNPNSFEASDQFFLVGVVMGLAIYNSTILDVALPPFAFRKLLASAPAAGAASAQRPRVKYTLDDLAEYRPRLASGLRQLLAFDGDVEGTFGLDFVVDTDRYGARVPVPLCPGGEGRAVTQANRREYVDLYVRHVLDTAVKRQFEPFKRGFYTVCGGNAFSLFRPEEIELLVRGSDEPLDISSLRAVAEYDGWGCERPDGDEPVVGWFWDALERASARDQRKMLLFVTGSDRIPAVGAASLAMKISCLGDDCGRYPIARTCFNLLSLWRYGSREKLEGILWRAVHESEGFGLK